MAAREGEWAWRCVRAALRGRSSRVRVTSFVFCAFRASMNRHWRNSPWVRCGQGMREGRFGRAKQPSPRDELRFLCVPRIDEPPFAELACGSDSRSMAVISAERTTKTSAMSANYALLPLPRPRGVESTRKVFQSQMRESGRKGFGDSWGDWAQDSA